MISRRSFNVCRLSEDIVSDPTRFQKSFDLVWNITESYVKAFLSSDVVIFENVAVPSTGDGNH